MGKLYFCVVRVLQYIEFTATAATVLEMHINSSLFSLLESRFSSLEVALESTGLEHRPSAQVQRLTLEWPPKDRV